MRGRGEMKWRKVVLLAVAVLLIFGLSGEAIARKPPVRGNPGPGPRPFEYGDPDWPATSRAGGPAARCLGDAWNRIPSVDGRVPQQRHEQALPAEEERRSSARRFVLRVMGVTIVVRR
jgi:hypothetical protein